MKICPNKEHRYISDDNFCYQCGKKKIELPKCSKCEKQVVSADIFCPNCGHPAKVQNPDDPADEQDPHDYEVEPAKEEE